jgi:acyl-CoA thioesterase
MISLDTLFTLRGAEPGRFHSRIPDGWQQGRGAFGGLVLGQMVAAAEASETDARRRLRSLTAELVGPVQPGAAELTVEPLRRGSSVTALAVRLLQGGEVQAHAVALLAADRPVAAWHEETPSSPPPWHAVPEIGLGSSGVGPAFAEFFEYRPLSGAPFSGAETATTSGYIRSRLAVERPGAAWVTALADAWWSAAVARFTAVRPFATITFTLQMVLDPTTLDVTEPLFHRARAPHASDGYALETRELWTGDGRLVAVNHQTVAVLG